MADLVPDAPETAPAAKAPTPPRDLAADRWHATERIRTRALLAGWRRFWVSHPEAPMVLKQIEALRGPRLRRRADWPDTPDYGDRVVRHADGRIEED